MKWKFSLIMIFPLCAILAFVGDERKKTKLWLIGDSTMSIKETRAYPEAGWGMPFKFMFDTTLVVDNRARNGRSTKTFMSEGLWRSVTDEMQEGDWVFIQFGHNDEVKEKVTAYTTPDEFRQNLRKYIADTRDKKGNPVLLTPVSRRKFADTLQVETHKEYSALVREVATSENVPLIDLDQLSMALYQRFGKEGSKLLFLQLSPGEHPNYPDGKQDNTHFNELGARLVAQLVLKAIRDQQLPLAQKIVQPIRKK